MNVLFTPQVLASRSKRNQVKDEEDVPGVAYGHFVGHPLPETEILEQKLRADPEETKNNILVTWHFTKQEDDEGSGDFWFVLFLIPSWISRRLKKKAVQLNEKYKLGKDGLWGEINYLQNHDEVESDIYCS